MLALGDNMVSNIEAAAQSTTEQCSWSAPMAESSRSCWLSSTMHQQHLARRDGHRMDSVRDALGGDRPQRCRSASSRDLSEARTGMGAVPGESWPA